MKYKNIISRGLIGFPLGVFICITITIGISIASGTSNYLSVTPELTEQIGSELNAFILQYLLSGILGSALSIGSLIWEAEKWSLAKQTISHFLLTSTVLFTISYICKWVDRTLIAAFMYFLVFAGVYFIIWLFQYSFLKRKITRMNNKLQNK